MSALPSRPALAILALALLVPLPTSHAQDTPHFSQPHFDLTLGWLSSVGDNASPLDYELIPLWLSYETTAHFSPLDLAAGQLVVRGRYSLLLEPITEGPENIFFGLVGGPSLEWWRGPLALFARAGGGVGLMDSKGDSIEGAQGQDFNLTWFAHAGLRWDLTGRLNFSTGVLFQHISNGGMASPNPGIDALGPTISLSWQF